MLANGDELKPPGSELGRGEIVNSNPYGLSVLISEWGGIPVDLGIAPDNREAIRAHIEAASDIDIFLPVGGASVGDHDYMRAAFADAGFEQVFERVAVQPGKPTWFSRLGDQRVLGLPGNPASSLVCAWLFLQPLLNSGAPPKLATGRLSAPVGANANRENYMRAYTEIDPSGICLITPAEDQDSSLLKPFLRCNALMKRPPGAPALKVGDLAEYLPIGSV